MDEQELSSRLSQITTQWSMVLQAHRGEDAAVPVAQRVLLLRYGGAVLRYLLGALHDADAAEDLAQEFSLRFLRGDFRNADPERGRFRDFLKTSVLNLIIDYQRKRHARSHQALDCGNEPAAAAELSDQLDRDFLDSWRSELLTQAWDRLLRLQEQTGQPFYTVLRHRAQNPEKRSADMAELLSRELAKPITAAGVRQTLHRAREKFADFLLDEVMNSLSRPNQEQLEEELVELGLLEYCRPALERRQKGN